MDFYADKVRELNCGKCGNKIDPSSLPALRPTTCDACGAEVQVPAMFDNFLLTRGLGFGATGYVCLAFDDNLHRQVAIKILKAGSENKEMIEKRTREARSLAALNHPNIVQIYSIGEFRDQPYIVMELLNGGSADQYIKLGEKITEQQILDYGIQLAKGLQAAHGVGLVHMDVKPDNILFDAKGNAKLIDFGAAVGKRGNNEEAAFQGTPYYVAPEIVKGETPDFRADVYSLGATLFHLLAGRPPFTGNTTKEVLAKRLKRTAPNILKINSKLHQKTADVIGGMLASNPEDRYDCYDALVADLEAARVASDLPIAHNVEQEEDDDPFAALGSAATSSKSSAASRRSTTAAKRQEKTSGGTQRTEQPKSIDKGMLGSFLNEKQQVDY